MSREVPMEKLSRDEMIDLVSRLQRGEGDDEEATRWAQALNRSVPHPGITDLIFYSDEDLTAEEIVDRALAYKPIELGPP